MTNNVTILEGDGTGHFRALSPSLPLRLAACTPEASRRATSPATASSTWPSSSAGSDGPDYRLDLLEPGAGAVRVLRRRSRWERACIQPRSWRALFSRRARSTWRSPITIRRRSRCSKGTVTAGFSFIDGQSRMPAGTPTAIATGDFTGDGQADLAVASQSPNSVTIELNQGNGQFVPPGSVGLVTAKHARRGRFYRRRRARRRHRRRCGRYPLSAGRAPTSRGASSRRSRSIPGCRPRYRRCCHRARASCWPAWTRPTTPSRCSRTTTDISVRVGTLATGLEPAQIVAADLNGNGEDDLIIRKPAMARSRSTWQPARRGLSAAHHD